MTPTPDHRPPEPSAPPDPVAPRPRRERIGRPALVSVSLVVVLFALTMVAVFADRAGKPSADSSPTVQPGVGSTPSAATNEGPSGSATVGPTIDVPATIDPTGTSDVTAALQGVLDRAPDGTTIVFEHGATYRVDGTLRLERRTALTIDGRGATLHPTTVADYERRTWSLIDSTNLVFRDMGIVGAHPNGGTYVPSHEHEHGFGIQGGGLVTIERVRISDVYGDCVYVAADDSGLWADGVRFLDSFCAATGRNGVAVVAGRNVEVARTSFTKIALFPFDVEPNKTSYVEGASVASFHDNRITAPIGDYLVAANGWGPVDGLSVADNLVTGTPFLLTVHPLDGSGYRRTNITITDNRSDTVAIGSGPVMDFADNDRLTVTGNIQPLRDGGVFAQVIGSCIVSVSGNTVDNGTEAVIEPAACP